MTQRTVREVLTIALCSAACSVSAFDYGVRADNDIQQQRVVDHYALIHGTAFAPDQYRVLVPFVLNPFIALASRITAPSDALREVYDVYYLVALTTLLYLLTLYLRQWFSYHEALVGALFVAAVVPITLRQHFLQPWSLLEPSLMTLGLMSAYRRWTWPLIPLTFMATLNRETGILLPVAFLCTAPREARFWRPALAALVLSAVVIIALRLWRPPAPPFVTLPQIWATNTHREGFLAALVNVPLFMGGAGWVLAVIGYPKAPVFTRRAALILPVYLPLIVVWGVWYEVRLLLPLYPVLIPYMLSALHGRASA